MQTEELVQWIERTGLRSAAIPLLETFRALGFVAAQALLLGQPLVSGLVDGGALDKATRWLEDPHQVEQLLQRLEGEDWQ